MPHPALSELIFHPPNGMELSLEQIVEIALSYYPVRLRLWARRFVQGDVDPTEREGTITFSSANMLVVKTGAERHTFKIAVDILARNEPVYLSDWWASPAGSRSPSTLRIGSMRWHFDFFGRVKSTS